MSDAPGSREHLERPAARRSPGREGTRAFAFSLLALSNLLAMVFLGEAFHAAGIATILAGVIVATRPAARPG